MYQNYGFDNARDFAVAVGTLMGEAAGEGLVGKAAVADVIANRMTDRTPGHNYSRFGNSFASQALAGQRPGSAGQFTTWSKSYGGSAYKTAKGWEGIALAAAIAPEKTKARMSPSMRAQFEETLDALTAVNVTKDLRGITRGAIQYSNIRGVDQANIDRVRASMAKGHVSIRNHDFYEGNEFDPNRPFDVDRALTSFAVNKAAGVPAYPTGVPDVAPPPMPAGTVETYDIPNLSTDPASAGFSLPETAPVNLSDVPQTGFMGYDISDVTLSPDVYNDMMGGFALENFAPAPAAPVDFSDVYAPDIMAGPTQMAGIGQSAPFGAFSPSPLGTDPGFEGFNAPGLIDQANFDARFDAGFPEPSISTAFDQDAPLGISPVGALGMGEQFGIEADPWGAGTGFAAGLGEGPYGFTPDFNAPSLEDRNAAALAQDRIDSFENRNFAGIAGPDFDRMAADLMSELAPQTPQLAVSPAAPQLAAPSFSAPPMQAPSPSPSTPMGDVSLPDLPETYVPAPPAIAAAPGAPVVGNTATQPTQSAQPSTGSLFGGLGDVFGDSTDFTIGGRPADFLDAMGAPEIANTYSPGVLDGWTGDALKGAAFGALTGGPVGALAGGVFGGLNPFGHVGSFVSDAFSPGSGDLMVSNGQGGWRAADMLDAMSNPDIARSLVGSSGGLLAGLFGPPSFDMPGGADSGFQDGGGWTGEMGGYGNADGSPSNNNPGLW